MKKFLIKTWILIKNRGEIKMDNLFKDILQDIKNTEKSIANEHFEAIVNTINSNINIMAIIYIMIKNNMATDEEFSEAKKEVSTPLIEKTKKSIIEKMKNELNAHQYLKDMFDIDEYEEELGKLFNTLID
jgi:hypothetical protein